MARRSHLKGRAPFRERDQIDLEDNLIFCFFLSFKFCPPYLLFGFYWIPERPGGQPNFPFFHLWILSSIFLWSLWKTIESWRATLFSFFFTAGSVTVLEVYATQKYTFWGDMLALSEARGLEKEGQVIFFISKLLLSICPDTLLVECLHFLAHIIVCCQIFLLWNSWRQAGTTCGASLQRIWPRIISL